MKKHTSRPILRLSMGAAVLSLCLMLQGCFTGALWSSDMRSRDKGYLTPITLGLDLVTLPVQLAVISGDRGHHHHRCR